MQLLPPPGGSWHAGASTPWQGRLAGSHGDLTPLPERSEHSSWPGTQILRPRRAGGLAPTLPRLRQPPSSPWAGRERAAAAAGGTDRQTDSTSTAPRALPRALGIPCPHRDWQSPGGSPHRPPASLIRGTNPSSAPRQSTRGCPHHPQTEPRVASDPKPFA